MNSQGPELVEMLISERALDRARLIWSAREARRASGVAWSGMSSPPAAPRAEEALLAQAQARLSARRQWRESAQGRFVSAVAQVQSAAAAVHADGERAREAAARGLKDELEVCDAAVRDLRRQAIALIASVRAARRAIRSALES